MKKVVAIVVLTFGINATAQNFVAVNAEEDNVLYWGYNNKYQFGDLDCSESDYVLEAVNCDLVKSNPETNDQEYIIKVKRGERTAKVNFVHDGKVVGSIDFDVKPLPAASLYWGNYESGTQVSDMKELRVGYAPGFNFDTSYEVTSWESSHGSQSFKGEGNMLSEDFLAYAETIPSGETITIVVTTKGADGISRKTGGSWIKTANR